MSTEEALKYLDEKFSYRFTSEDEEFTKALERETIAPPVVPDYNGKRPPPRRGGGYNRQQNDFHGGGRRDNDRRDDRRGRYDRNDSYR